MDIDLSKLSSYNKKLLKNMISLAGDYERAKAMIGEVVLNDQPQNLKGRIVLSYLKFINTKLITAYRIINGFTLEDLHPNLSTRFNDYFTLYDITRSLYECFLQSNFIISRYNSPDEIRYLNLWWQIRAYSERSIMAKNRDMNNDRLIEEVSLIKEYTDKIDLYYHIFKKRDIADFDLDKKTNLPKWPTPGKLFKSAGIHVTQHNNIYKIHSIYAHCEPFAMLQVEYASLGKDPLDALVTIFVQARTIVDISLLALKGFANVFEAVDKIFAENKYIQVHFEAATSWLSTSIEDLNKNV